MRFLIVDDDHKNRILMEGFLESTGECFHAESGPDAIDAFQSAWRDWRPFDLILLDIMMPEMDGAEVLERIRDLEKQKQVVDRHKVKILMVTASARQSTVVQCIKKGCDGYIVKPIKLHTIYRELQRLELIN